VGKCNVRREKSGTLRTVGPIVCGHVWGGEKIHGARGEGGRDQGGGLREFGGGDQQEGESVKGGSRGSEFKMIPIFSVKGGVSG